MLLLSIFISVCIGFLVVFFLIRKMNIGNYSIFLKLFLGIGTGIGISSCIFFYYLIFFGFPTRPYYVSVEIGILLLLLLTSIRYNSLLYNCKFFRGSMDPVIGNKTLSMIKLFFAVALLLDIFTFIISSTTFPHGQSDAITIYNLRARFIFRSGENWKTAFSSSLFWFHHMDYPPMIPLSIVRSWIYNLKETQVVAQLIGFLYTFSTVGLATIAILLLRGQFHGYFSGLILLGSFSLIKQGAAQQADVPLAFFFLATVILLYLGPRFPGEGGFYCLAGLMAGFAAWTKNEGILFLVSVVIILSIKSVFCQDRRNGFIEFFYFLLGAAPVAVGIIYFKQNIAPPNYLFSSFSFPSAIEKIMNIHRHIDIIKAFFYKFSYTLFPMLIVYSIFTGINISEDEKPSLISLILLLGIMILGYYFVYLLSPRDLNWHLMSSLHRLFVQLLPCVLFVFFMLIQAPEYVEK